MDGFHSHWERYHVREIKGALVVNHSHWEPDKLQLICLDDGIVFKEVEIKEPPVA